MNLSFDTKLAEPYKSQSQKARVLTEGWVDGSVFCPNCGQVDLNKHKSNKPVADFFCQNCREDFELKSKQGSIGKKIVDGTYRTMLERLLSSENPNLFLLNYDLASFKVTDFFVIPKHFFVPSIIEKRKALAPTARRSGWIGCNILINQIPQVGRIFFVRDKQIEPKVKVLSEWQKTLFLREESEVSAKGWLLDVMRCVEMFGKSEFLLDDVYAFEAELSRLYPDNKHIKDKIRQQLQILRDRNYLNFLGQGKYQLT